MDWMKAAAEQLPAGAFLMVKGNPMTIGWGQFGVLWGRKTFTVYVRKSRYTNELLERENTFTVSVPEIGTMREELLFCGTKSGRDVNKMKALNASYFKSRFGAQDGFLGCKYHIECRILNRSVLDEQSIEDDSLLKRYYPNGDSHTMYIGEIIGISEEEK